LLKFFRKAGNVAVISRRANVIKNDGTLKEHRQIVKYMETGMKAKLGLFYGQRDAA
jgi:hypothetical protein